MLISQTRKVAVRSGPASRSSVASILVLLLAASSVLLAGCGGSGPNSSSPGLTEPQPNDHYEFHITNQSSDKKLHVHNTHRGKCVAHEIPEDFDIDPGRTWADWFDTVTDGSCYWEDKVQILQLTYDPYHEIYVDYWQIAHEDDWNVEKYGGTGTIEHKIISNPPISTYCNFEQLEMPCGTNGYKP